MNAGAHQEPSDLDPGGLMAQPEPDDELIEFLERTQLVSDTSRPVPRAPLTARARAGLWALRIFTLLLAVIVIYAFVAQLT